MKEFIDICRSELMAYIDLLSHWQKSINLVSDSSLKEAWTRHILDSAQLYPYLDKPIQNLVDFGSGAGFPALVLALLNQKNNGPVQHFFLIESDLKKGIFLREVIRHFNLPATVLSQRIETVSDVRADVVTARALAPLDTLLKLGKTIIIPSTTCLFLKGKNVDTEIQSCSIPCQIQKIPSLTDTDATILKITEVHYD